MKKQLIAKLVVLCLVLAMLPTAAFAASGWGTTVPDGATVVRKTGDIYYWTTDDVVPVNPGTSSTPADPSTTETITVVEEVTVENGEVTLEAEVVDGVASVELTAKAVESLAEQVEGDSVTLVVKAENATKVAVTMPAEALTALAEKTGADLTVKSEVATITIPNAAVKSVFANAKSVQVSAEISNNGIVTIAVLADSKAVTKDVKGLVVEF